MYISICISKYISYEIIKMYIGTQANTKYYNVFAKSTRLQKTFRSIKSNTIPRIFLLTNICVFGQLDSSEQIIF